MQKIMPCLWFDTQAEEAARFYTSIFKNSKIESISYNGDNMPGEKGKVLTVIFQLDGQKFMGLNGGPVFNFSEAVSFVVDCADQEEVDYYWNKLLEGGEPSQCGWLKDKYGLSWQIVPSALDQLMNDPDPVKAGRVAQAMLKMVKLDIAELRRAYEQG
jgi:predicted 3-demethylubiquinone-9 3-methyltransferase (glyoxalase superfamily)